MGAAFIDAFSNGETATIVTSTGTLAGMPVIYRNLREGGLAAESDVAVEGETYSCRVRIADIPGVAEGNTLTITSTGETFTIRGLPDDGRGMAQLILEPVETD